MPLDREWKRARWEGVDLLSDAVCRSKFSKRKRDTLVTIVIRPREKTPTRPHFWCCGICIYGRRKNGRMKTRHAIVSQNITSSWNKEGTNAVCGHIKGVINAKNSPRVPNGTFWTSNRPRIYLIRITQQQGVCGAHQLFEIGKHQKVSRQNEVNQHTPTYTEMINNALRRRLKFSVNNP